MNLQQKISLWLGCIIFSLSNLCPPWAAVSKTLEGHVRRESFSGFHYVWHDFGTVATYIRPDFSRLILLDVAIVAVTLIAVLTMKGQADWQFWIIGRRISSWHFSRYQQAALTLTLLSVGTMLVSGANWRLSLGILSLGLTLAWAVGSYNRLLPYLCMIMGLAILATPACLSWRQHRLAVREFDRSVQAFEANIPQLAQRYPLNAECPVSSPPRSADLAARGFEVVEEEQIIPISNSTELYAVLTQMNYPEDERKSIEARIAKDLDSKKIGRTDWVFPCLSTPKSKVDFQISAATGSEFLKSLPPWFMGAVVKGVNVTSMPTDEKPGAPPSEFRALSAFWSSPLVSLLGVVIGATGGGNLIRLRQKGAARNHDS